MHVHFRLPAGKPFDAVDDVSFDIYKGETFGLVGESGSGKTTIGRAIIRIHPVSGGEISLQGRADQRQHHPGAWTSKVTQEDSDDLSGPHGLPERAGQGGLHRLRGPDPIAQHLTEAERQETVDRGRWTTVGLLPEFASRFPHEFSGGQRQRIGIARALIMEPGIHHC